MAFSKFQICSQALIKIDKNTIQSFNDGRKEAEVAGVLYELNKLAALTDSEWRFNTHFMELTREVTTPVDTRYLYQFVPPTGFLKIVSYFDEHGNPVFDRDLFQGRIYRNNPRLFVRYLRDIRESDFPPYFVDYLSNRLAHEFCEPLNGEQSVRLDAERNRTNAFARAVNVDGPMRKPMNFDPARGRSPTIARRFA